MLVIVELLKRDRMGYLPGSRREVLNGTAIDLERMGLAKRVEQPKPKVKRKAKVKPDDEYRLDSTSQDGGD